MSSNSTTRWWSRRPWADTFVPFDTEPFAPDRGRRLVTVEDAHRLERARQAIAFQPRQGFLLATRVPRRAAVPAMAADAGA